MNIQLILYILHNEETDLNSARQNIFEKVIEIYENKVEEIKKIGFDFSIAERSALLRIVDKFWTDHIDAMNILRNEITSQALDKIEEIEIDKQNELRREKKNKAVLKTVENFKKISWGEE